MYRRIIISFFLIAGIPLQAAEPVIDCVEVKTRSRINSSVSIWFRLPQGRGGQTGGKMRVLILFGGHNCDGKELVSGKQGRADWADCHDICLVAPTFRDDNYWQPEKWSGRALQDALKRIASYAPISIKGLLFYGYSAGSQASNLFAAQYPAQCRAYVSHACGVFHKPSLRLRHIAGLITCGDVDAGRYLISSQFVQDYRKLGISLIWKCFPNHPHDIPPDSIRLAQAFLAYYHWSFLTDLGIPCRKALAKHVQTFVGDEIDGLYFESGSAEAKGILEEDRVLLPSQSIATAWGKPGRSIKKTTPSVR